MRKKWTANPPKVLYPDGRCVCITDMDEEEKTRVANILSDHFFAAMGYVRVKEENEDDGNQVN